MDVFAMPQKAFFVSDLHVRIATLPNFTAEPKLLLCTKRKAAFNQLHRFVDAYIRGHGHQNVNMIWHDDEIVDLHFAISHVSP